MCVSSKASGGTVRLSGVPTAEALDATEDVLLDDFEEEDEEDDEDGGADDDTALDFEDEVLDATLLLDEELAAAGLYEHHDALLGAPGKFESWQAKLPVKVA